VLTFVAASLLVGYVVGGCGGGSGTSNLNSDNLDDFVAEIRRGADVDYTPIKDAADAVERADVIVVGTLTNVRDGIAIHGEDGLWNEMLTLEVSVEDVVIGRALAPTDPIVVQVFSSAVVDVEALRASLPKERVILLLDEITDWSPFAGARFTYPDGIDGETRLFTPFSDGVVFDGTEGPVNMLVDPADLADGWAGDSTFEVLIDRLVAATHPN